MKNGFTQQELLVTLGIISVICSFAFPSFKDLIDKENAATLANSLFDHLNFARSTAITKNVTITICSSVDNIKCYSGKDWSNKSILIFEDNNMNGKREPTEPLLRNFGFGLKKNSLVWRSFGNKHYLQWQPTGSTYYQNGNFTFCPENKNLHNAKKIILNTAGRLYFGSDNNGDGIQEGTDGKNVSC